MLESTNHPWMKIYTPFYWYIYGHNTKTESSFIHLWYVTCYVYHYACQTYVSRKFLKETVHPHISFTQLAIYFSHLHDHTNHYFIRHCLANHTLAFTLIVFKDILTKISSDYYQDYTNCKYVWPAKTKFEWRWQTKELFFEAE